MDLRHIILTFLVICVCSCTAFFQSHASPKVFGLLKNLNPFQFLIMRSPPVPKNPKDYCSSIGGTWYEPQCLEFFPIRLTFLDARNHCVRRGGDLWVPTDSDLKNPFFFQKLILGFPELFKSSRGWFYIGITKSHGSGYKGIDGRDVSDSPLIRTNDEGEDLCSILDFEIGNLFFGPKHCEKEESFVCEYLVNVKPISVKKPIGIKPYKFW